MRWLYRPALAAIAAMLGSAAMAGDVDDGLKAILAVSKEGKGNAEAAAGWKKVTTGGASAILPTLKSFDSANATSANWLRSAIDALVQAEKAGKRKLPAAELEAFVKDGKRNADARRIAFELLREEAPESALALLPAMIDDVSLDIRRDAIADRITAAKKLDDKARTAEYRKLIASGRDKDQVEELAKLLETNEVKIDLTKHFGYVTQWHVIGPFDSTEGAGFFKAYPPEANVNLAGEYEGKAGAKVKWKPAQSDATYGTIDLNKAVGKHMDSVAYAYAVIVVDKDTPAEIRLASQNSVQLFLNGKKIFEREEYHHGTRMDQHAGQGILKAGRNEILVKVCQNNQTDTWAQVWAVAERVCDSTGGNLPIKQEFEGKIIEPGALKPAEKEAK